jgi:hypothetical protein
MADFRGHYTAPYQKIVARRMLHLVNRIDDAASSLSCMFIKQLAMLPLVLLHFINYISNLYNE